MSIYRRNIKHIVARLFIIAFVFIIGLKESVAQDTLHHPKQDSVMAWDSSGKPVVVFDSSMFATPVKKKHDPHKATMRSLMVPGWGQIYNQQYWKVPIVWGALAIPITTYIKNNSWYKDAANNYNIVYTITQQGDKDASKVSAALAGSPDYQTYWNVIYSKRPTTAGTEFLSAVQSNRNFYRRNRDYSVLWLLILWGVNVADATVFGHLKDFDVSPNLNVQISPTYLQSIRGPGINVIFNLK